MKIARHNAKKHKIAEKINFINCSWFDGLQTAARYDAVISNPPYIAGEIFTRPFGGSAGSLQPEVGKFEPRLALDGGEGGMQAITRIAAELGNVLKSGGWFFLEIGADQQREVFDVFRRTAAYDSMEIFPDYAGLPRVFQARKK